MPLDDNCINKNMRIASISKCLTNLYFGKFNINQ